MDVETREKILTDLESAASRERFDAVLKSAYAAGWTLAQLGEIAGVSREAIRLRLRRPVPPEMLVEYASPIKVRVREKRMQKRTAARYGRRRILGIRATSPVMRVPVVTLNRIAELNELVSTVRGWTPLDDPARLAQHEYKQLLLETFSKYQLPEGQLGLVFGLSKRTFETWLRNHGELGGPFPSQRGYKGVLLDPRKSRGLKKMPDDDTVMRLSPKEAARVLSRPVESIYNRRATIRRQEHTRGGE